MRVLIGCPVYKREWILPLWFQAIEQQNFPLEDVGFIFQTAPDDHATHEALLSFAGNHPELFCFDMLMDETSTHSTHPEPTSEGAGKWRAWNRDKYQVMVNMRNNLLSHVSCYAPDRYFSLDSDILLENPESINILIQATETLGDVVSPLAYMYPKGTAFPSVMTWVREVGGPATRRTYDFSKSFQADVVMAAVMMTPPVYQEVRYRFHRLGEDLGFAADATYKGYNLFCVPEVYGAHIMSKFHLDQYSQAGDARSPNTRLINVKAAV